MSSFYSLSVTGIIFSTPYPFDLVADLDYVAVSGPIRALSCEPVVCRDVTIINDDTVETGEETFTVRLERTPTLDYRIQLDNEPASITITDDDGMRMHWAITYVH